MKKLFIVIILIVSMVTLTSCLKEEKVPASGKTKITFMNTFAIQSNNLMGHKIDSFEKTYPMFEVGVTSYPQKDETNKSVTISGSNLCLINKNNELETLGGWLFLKWITNYDNSLYLSTHTNYLPIRKSVFEATAFQELISKNELMYEVKKIGFKQNNIFKTVIPFKNDVNKIIEELVVDIINGKMMDEAYVSAVEKCQK